MLGARCEKWCFCARRRNFAFFGNNKRAIGGWILRPPFRTENENGVEDCFDFIKIHATNGVVLYGLQKQRLNCGGYVVSLLSENW